MAGYHLATDPWYRYPDPAADFEVLDRISDEFTEDFDDTERAPFRASLFSYPSQFEDLVSLVGVAGFPVTRHDPEVQAQARVIREQRVAQLPAPPTP